MFIFYNNNNNNNYYYYYYFQDLESHPLSLHQSSIKMLILQYFGTLVDLQGHNQLTDLLTMAPGL